MRAWSPRRGGAAVLSGMRYSLRRWGTGARVARRSFVAPFVGRVFHVNMSAPAESDRGARGVDANGCKSAHDPGNLSGFFVAVTIRRQKWNVWKSPRPG